MKSTWISVLAAMLFTAGLLQHTHAAPTDDPAPADETEAAQNAEADEGDAKKKKKLVNGFYAEVSVGTTSMDPLDTSVRSSPTQSSVNTMTFNDMDYTRAAIGWRLPAEKGSFRLLFQGYNESGYEFNAIGRFSAPDPLLGLSGFAVSENLDWWTVNVVDGTLTAQRTPPQWNPATDDANMDGAISRDEVSYNGPDITINSTLARDLENRVQTVDIVYGRDFGPRRVRGRWWTGMRYWAYEGALLQGAWLRSPQTGEGFTDGQFLRLLSAQQKSDGLGPTASLGLNVNFFEERLQLFTNFQVAFTISSVEVDSGQFITIADLDPTQIVTIPAQLRQKRSRTSWQTHADAGVRLNLKKSGLSLEMAYFIDGFLDAVLTPTEIRVPQSPQEASQGTSAIFKTQDIVVDGWRAGVAFQF